MGIFDRLNQGEVTRRQMERDEAERRQQAANARRKEREAKEARRLAREQEQGGGSGVRQFMAREVLDVVGVFDTDPREGN